MQFCSMDSLKQAYNGSFEPNSEVISQLHHTGVSCCDENQLYLEWQHFLVDTTECGHCPGPR